MNIEGLRFGPRLNRHVLRRADNATVSFCYDLLRLETWEASRGIAISMSAPRLPHILVVDDDLQIRTMLARYLRDHGLRVSTAEDGARLMEAVATTPFDVVILDVMMPGDDGFTLCQRLRTRSDVPIILLTARDSETDRVVGLELGADDYVPKPFNPRELLARVRATLRRAEMTERRRNVDKSHLFRFADWTLDVTKRALTSPKGILTDLTTGEFDLLTAFVQHPQSVLTRDHLLDLVHGRSSLNIDRSIDVQISRLRRKIEPDPQNPQFIKTVRNGGYYFTADVDELA